MYKFIIGCDMSKSTFDVAYWDEKPIYIGSFSNNDKGFESCLLDLSKRTELSVSSWFIVFENTGTYSKLFKRFLFSNEIACMEENPLKIKRNAPMKRGKSDPLDAKMICEYAVEKLHKLVPDTPKNASVESIRHLLSRRDLLLKQKTALQSSHKEQKKTMSCDIVEQLSKMNTKVVKLLVQQISTIEKKIKELIQKDNRIKENYDLATSVIGIGLITGSMMICLTNNFQEAFNARKFSCFTGISPFPNESGIRTGRRKISKKGNKTMKGLISNCVMAAIQHDPFINNYYYRLLAKNKPARLIKNNIKNKIISRVFSAIKRKTPYVKLAYQ